MFYTCYPVLFFTWEFFFFFFLIFLSVPHTMWILSSLTRYRTCAPSIVSRVLTTRPPGKSLPSLVNQTFSVELKMPPIPVLITSHTRFLPNIITILFLVFVVQFLWLYFYDVCGPLCNTELEYYFICFKIFCECSCLSFSLSLCCMPLFTLSLFSTLCEVNQCWYLKWKFILYRMNRPHYIFLVSYWWAYFNIYF